MLLRQLALLLALTVRTAHAGTNEFGRKFLKDISEKGDVVTLPSGLRYKVLEEGDGEKHPLAGTDCTCHYEGRTAQEWSKTPQGKKFDSSFDRGSPANFAPSGVIKGWTEAMQLMVEGDKWELYIPSELGYGDSGQGGDIGPGDVLVFTLHMIQINGESTPAAPRGPVPWTDLEGDEAKLAAWLEPLLPHIPKVLLSLRQPVAKSNLFDGFKRAAKHTAKTLGLPTPEGTPKPYSFSVDAPSFAFTAASKFVKGKYTTDAIAQAEKLSTPGLYVGDGSAWTKCKTGRPTEVTADAIWGAIIECIWDFDPKLKPTLKSEL